MRGHLHLLLLLLATATATRAAPLSRVGVAPALIDAAGGDPAFSSDAIAAAVARGLAGGAVQVVTANEVRGIAARAARSGLVCDAREAACAARLAAFSGLDFIVVSRALHDDAGSAIELTLVDGHDGARLRQRRAPLQDIGRGVEAVATALLNDAPVPGRLEVSGPVGGAVDVDGVARGVAPLTLEIGAGLHRVGERVVQVPADGIAVIELTAAPEADVGLALAVTAAVGASVGLGAGVAAFVIAPDVARRDAITARAWNDAVATGQGLVAVAAVGVAVAVVGGGLWAVSTWEAP